MKKTSAAQIAEASGGRLIREGSSRFITGVRHDSREVLPGEMFVAIKGENQDGHRYIPQVIEKGCAAVLVSDTDECPPDADVSVILVDDTVEAMGKTASWYIDSLGVRRVAVTGSVGKTSTRDMIYYVLSEKYNCGRNLKNFNNNIGLPISIFQFDENTEAAVLEMGMDAFGEIEYLSSIVKPEIGVITNIGIAHMEKLGSREGIFRAKMEITKNILPESEGGTLVFAGDGEFLTKERTAGDYGQVEVGTGENADLRVSAVEDHGIEGISFDVEYEEEGAAVKTHVEMPAAGAHNAMNAAIALAVGRKLGVSVAEGAEGLRKTELTGSRLRKIDGKSVRIIDDTYNANPFSMMSALDVLAESEAARRVAVLGDMFELGSDEKELHRKVGEHAKAVGVDELITIGGLAENIAEGGAGTHFRDKEAFMEVMDEYVRPGDLVLVKASRGMHLEEIVEKLRTL
ncbi:MAG: UDP-N-acetylmuramoyl-tripeptide--D-alanyl-D-alanine ligase [Bacillota bacterium]